MFVGYHYSRFFYLSLTLKALKVAAPVARLVEPRLTVRTEIGNENWALVASVRSLFARWPTDGSSVRTEGQLMSVSRDPSQAPDTLTI